MIAARGLEEVSVGDYVLSGGELAAMVLIDACVRLLAGRHGQGGLGGRGELRRRGCWNTRNIPARRCWRGLAIPDVLISGNHGKIAQWRQTEAERLTRERRPDLWADLSGGVQKAC